MEGKAVVRTQAGLGDLVEILAKALLSGIGVAVAMSLAILALCATAQAASLNDPKTGALLIRTATAGEYVVAPTVETQVGIEVNGMIARTRVSQVFHNAGTESVEGVYVFPLPEKAAVDHLWMRIGARTIEGQIREKEEARRTYEQARREGRKAALVEQLRPNLFTNTVAHIGPEEYVRVTIEYQQTLAYENGEYRLRFPLAVTPRYFPAAYRDDPAPETSADAAASDDEEELFHDGCGGGQVNVVDIVVMLDAGLPLARLDSSYHEVTIEKQAGHRTAVMLTKDQEEADRDFELTWSVATGASAQAALFTQNADGTDYALIMVVPPQPSAAEALAFQRLPRETILIVDTSGSMQGASIAQARQALDHALGTLTERDRFNVVEFNSIMRALHPEAMPATSDNIRGAKEWVKGLQARGGTEMAPALTFALNGRETPGHLRQVIFMTDGAVGNEDELFRLITQRLGSSRLFTVGIGSAPNAHFMTKAAQFGRGTFTHIGDVREVNEKMTRLFAKIEAPVLRDVALRWADGTPVESFPARVPDLYLGEPVLISAAGKSPLGTVVVTGLRGNQPWSVALTPSHDAQAAGVGALWARSKIASLMDEVTRGADPATVRPKVVKVALEHHLVSAYTSLVAVDVTPTAAGGKTRTALVKASLPRGSGDGMQLPQTDTAATLHFLLGLIALMCAGMVAVIGRHAGSHA